MTTAKVTLTIIAHLEGDEQDEDIVEQIAELGDKFASFVNDFTIFEASLASHHFQYVSIERPDEVGIDEPQGYGACPNCGCDACEDILNKANEDHPTQQDLQDAIENGTARLATPEERAAFDKALDDELEDPAPNPEDWSRLD